MLPEPTDDEAIPLSTHNMAEKRAILRARARALARAPAPAGPAVNQMEVIEFVLALEHYAVETSHVREVYPLKGLTPLPCTPPFVLGIVSVRGQILPVYDLKRFFDLPDRGIGELNKLIILRSGVLELGILADAITGLRMIDPGTLQPTLPTLTGVREAYLKGITHERIIVLDVAKLLADERLRVNEEVHPAP